MATYIVDGSLNHDGVTFAHGSEFETEDDALAKELRKVGALKLPSELLPAEDVQAELERLRAENDALKAREQNGASDDAGDAPKSDETSEQGE